MKLFLLRHAKTKQFSSSGSDFERELKEKGKKQLVLMRSHLKEEFPHLKVDVLLSTARRTVQTYEEMNSNLAEFNCLRMSELYLADLSLHLNKIWNMDSANDLFIIGHNYGISETASYFTQTEITLPTCGLVVLEFDIDNWKEASRGCATLFHQFYPQVLE